MKHMSLLFGLVLGLCLNPARSAADEEKPPQRTIIVNGTATVQVVPDEVVLTAGVEKLDLKLDVAADEVRAGIKQALAVAKEMGIEEKDLQTARLVVQPQYDEGNAYRKGSRKLIGYLASGQIAITLREPSKCEELISSLLKAGINTIEDIDFRTSEAREYRDKARLMAVQAAKEKAALLAGEFGMTVGKPITIAEDPESGRSSNRGVLVNYLTGGGYRTEDGEGQTVALGQISITAKVSITFDLE